MPDLLACRVRAAAMYVKELLPSRYQRLLRRDWPALRLRHLPAGREGVFQKPRDGQPPLVAVDIGYAQRASDGDLLELVAHETLHACHYLAGLPFVSMEHEHARVARELRQLGF
jgi:hypothetical protein